MIIYLVCRKIPFLMLYTQIISWLCIFIILLYKAIADTVFPVQNYILFLWSILQIQVLTND